MKNCWPLVVAAFEKLEPPRKAYYESASQKTKLEFQRAKRAKANAQVCKKPKIAIDPPPPNAVTDHYIASPLALTSDTMGDIPRGGEHREVALPTHTRPIDLTANLTTCSHASSDSFPSLGAVAARDIGIDAYSAFSPELLQRVYSKPDWIDGKVHKYGQCEQDYSSKSECIEAGNAFPATVAYEHHCEGLCECFTPPDILSWQKRICECLCKEAKLVSPTGKAAHMSAKGLVVALEQFDSLEEPMCHCAVTFATASTALGAWHRFQETCCFVVLDPASTTEARPLTPGVTNK